MLDATRCRGALQQPPSCAATARLPFAAAKPLAYVPLLHRPFFHSHRDTGTSSSPAARGASGAVQGHPLVGGPRDRAHPSPPPWYATPTISCVWNAHLLRSPANPLRATPRERSHPQRVALSQRLARGDLAAAAEVGPTSTTRVPSGQCDHAALDGDNLTLYWRSCAFDPRFLDFSHSRPHCPPKGLDAHSGRALETWRAMRTPASQPSRHRPSR